MDIFVFEFDAKGGAIESFSVAVGAWHVELFEEAHFEFNSSCPGAGFAASVSGIEAEPRWGEASGFCIACSGEYFSDRVPETAVGRGGRSGRASDGRLVYFDDPFDGLSAFEVGPVFGCWGGRIELRLDGGDKGIVNEGAFAGPAYAGDGDETAEWERNREVFEIVLVDAFDGEFGMIGGDLSSGSLVHSIRGIKVFSGQRDWGFFQIVPFALGDD